MWGALSLLLPGSFHGVNRLLCLRSPAGGLALFPAWGITKEATVDVYVQIFEHFLLFVLGKYLGAEWLDPITGIRLICQKTVF